jgi:glycosyltransferase involved in cell wall biosynthesis
MDDGSTDQTVRIASKLLKEHPNFAVLSLAHQGSPGQGRNLGASLATGKWIWFLDCDDMPLSSNLEELLQVGQELNSDLLILRYLIRNDHEKYWELSFDHPLFSTLTTSNYHVFRNWISEPKLIRLSPHPSRIIFSKDFIQKNNLKYDINENFEDGSFWPRAMIRAENVITWNWPELVYRVRRDSITYSQELGRKLFLLKQFEKIFQDPDLRKENNVTLWGSTYLYAIEMISWPLNSLRGQMRKEYKQTARKAIISSGSQWFAHDSSIGLKERANLTKSLFKIGSFNFGIKCLLGFLP